jgi:hypothetical protein
MQRQLWTEAAAYTVRGGRLALFDRAVQSTCLIDVAASSFLMYHEKVKTTKVYVRDCRYGVASGL